MRLQLLLSALIFPAAISAVDFPIHKEVLDNGLTVLLYPNSQAPTVSCRLFYVTGSVNEVPGSSGLAHILEHELFKGTKKVGVTDFAKDSVLMAKEDSVMALSQASAVAGDSISAKKFRAEYDSLVEEERKFMVKEELWSAYQQAGGTGLNAFTTDLMTAYIVTLPKNRVELFLYLESDRMQNAILREFYSERDVVREERRMRYDDRPSGRYFETLNGLIYEAFPYRVPTIGWPSDIMNLTREQAAEHYRKYYKPRNAILVLAGDLDTTQTMNLVKKYFAEIPSGEAFAPITVRDPEPAGEKRLTVYRPDAPHRMDFCFKTPGVGDSSLYALDIAEGVLNGRSGRLYKKLVEEKKLAVSASAGNSVNKYVSEFYISVTLRPDANPDSVEAIVWSELEKLKNEPVSARELEKVKNRAMMGLVESFLDMENVATQLAWYEMFGDYKILLNWPDQLGKVSPEAVQNVAKKTFKHKNATVGLLLKGEER
ncbi:MAG: pitrilysin family protein [Hallerella porci]|uniref:Zn-dependent peptidase n=1 Tax=Hallerella porci TaxID=1945871 RepID=A0ABX5LJI7_9BACT|nr:MULTISPECIES: pitrilysin family protein [Hallerella]MCI5601818.1 insulinase family protein [Hallerella sp.]MDY3921823.1 pitrilysin family protein [Hallerella porci]PWK95567.1 putative Zn-dependent peptidase [Hallerella porci]